MKIKTLRQESQQDFLNEISYMRDVGATLAVALDGLGQCSAIKGRGEPRPYNRSDNPNSSPPYLPLKGR
jgi:hypothetical protein